VRLEQPGGGAVAADLAPLVAVRTGTPLSPRDVRRSIERLFSTGRFADVVARSEETPEGVIIVFELVPVVRIAKVEVTGAKTLRRDEVLSAARLAEGTEYWPERLEAAKAGLLAAYARRGFNAAQIAATATPSPTGVQVLLAVQEGQPTRIAAVHFEGELGLPVERLASAFGMRPGDVLDRTRFDGATDSLRSLYRDTHHSRARVGLPRVELGPAGALVTVPVEAGPAFKIRFEGNRRFPDAWLRSVLSIEPGESLDRAVIDGLGRKLETFYRYRGFPDVRVEPREVESPDGTRAVVVFHVSEGLPARVSRIVFEGRSGFSESDLRTVLEASIRAHAPQPSGETHSDEDPLKMEGRSQSVQRPDIPDPRPSEVFVEEAWRDAAEAMQRAYRDQGWSQARVSLAQLTENVPARTFTARLRIDEGVRTLVQSVRIEGLPPGIPAPDLPSLQPGAPFSEARLEEARNAAVRWLGRRSYLFARADADAGLSADRREARPVIHLEPGPAVKVGEVVVRGLQRTDEALVRANLRLAPGAPLDPEALFDSQRELLLLGLFRTASVRLISPDTPEPVKDVVVELRERPRLSGSVGVGYSLEEGPRLTGDLNYPNVFGQGINFGLRGKINYVGASLQPTQDFVDAADLQGLNGLDFSINASLSQPRIYQFLPARVGARLTAVAERVHRPTYFFSRVSALFGVDWAITKWLQLTGNYLIENELIRAQAGVGELLVPNRTDAERLRFPTGNYFLQTLGSGVTLDFRDDPANPHLGLLFAITGEITKDFTAETTDVNGNNAVPAKIFTFKTAAGVTGYAPLGPRAVFALSVRGGKIFALEPDSQIIQPKRFFMGGASTLRGFRDDGLIPQDVRGEYAVERAQCEALVWTGGCTSRALALKSGSTLPSEGGTLFELVKAELRFPVVGDFDLGVFVEAGNLWFSTRHWDPFDLRPVAGLGIRYVTPVGPLALDVGFNLDPDDRLNEPIFAVQFSVGLF
jgi:outer membrane protein insertion porin family